MPELAAIDPLRSEFRSVLATGSIIIIIIIFVIIIIIISVIIIIIISEPCLSWAASDPIPLEVVSEARSEKK